MTEKKKPTKAKVERKPNRKPLPQADVDVDVGEGLYGGVRGGGMADAFSHSRDVGKTWGPTDPFEGVLYTTSKWKGLPNYECMFCGFATVDHESALEHAAEAHAPPEAEIINTGLVTESGAPITRAVEPAKED
jgi:hypothetical protein